MEGTLPIDSSSTLKHTIANGLNKLLRERPDNPMEFIANYLQCNARKKTVTMNESYSSLNKSSLYFSMIFGKSMNRAIKETLFLKPKNPIIHVADCLER